MKVIIDGPRRAVTLEAPDDLNALSAELRHCSAEVATSLLGDLGRVEEPYVWLRIETLRALAAPPARADWDSRFEATMAYASSKGWVDPSATLVRAHIAPPPAETIGSFGP